MDDREPPPYQPRQAALPSDRADEERALVEPLIPPAKRGGRRRTVVAREVVNGAMDVLGTGRQRRYPPKDLPPKSTAHDCLTRWNCDGGSSASITHSMCSVGRRRAEPSARPPV